MLFVEASGAFIDHLSIIRVSTGQMVSRRVRKNGLLVCLKVNDFLVGANSPNFLPTISSWIMTSL